MPTRAEIRRFTDVLRREMDRLRSDSVYVVFQRTGPYDHNPYDEPLPSFDHPRVYRALYDAVDYAKDPRTHGTYPTKISRFARTDLPPAKSRAVRPVPSQVVWRS